MAADFLQDYSGLAAAGSAFNSFADAYARAQDREMKRMETQAQIEATKQRIQREKDQSDIDMFKQNITRNQQTGAIEETPLTERQKGEQNIKAFGEGGQITRDASGNAIAIKADPNSPKVIAAKNAGIRSEISRERLDETRNQNASKAGKDIQEDSVLKQIQAARYSLDRGRSLLNGKTPLTYNNLNAVQQDVINGMSNAGISSEGKVNREMQESWAGRWNNLMAKAGKYGPDNDIRVQDPGLYKQIHDLLEEVDSASAKNAADRFQKLKKNYSQTTNQKTKATLDSLESDYAAPQEGLVSGGLVNSPKGLVGASVVGSKPHPQDSQAVQWAKTHMSDPRAAQILKENGL